MKLRKGNRCNKPKQRATACQTVLTVQKPVEAIISVIAISCYFTTSNKTSLYVRVILSICFRSHSTPGTSN